MTTQPNLADLPSSLRNKITLEPLLDDRRAFLTDAGVEDPGPCWVLSGALNSAGYTQIKYRGKVWGSHRLIWHHLVERLPHPGKVRTSAGGTGLVLDHIHRYRRCCNPTHIRKVSQSENTRTGGRHDAP